MTRQATAGRLLAMAVTMVVLAWMAGAALASDTTGGPRAAPAKSAGAGSGGEAATEAAAARQPASSAAASGPGLAAEAVTTEVLDNGDGTATVTVLLSVVNGGPAEVRDVSLVDDVVQHLADLAPSGFLTLDGSLLANPRWDGTGATSAVADGQALQPGQAGDVGISFIVEAGPSLVGSDSQPPADNQVLAAGVDGDGQPLTAAATHAVELDALAR